MQPHDGIYYRQTEPASSPIGRKFAEWLEQLVGDLRGKAWPFIFNNHFTIRRNSHDDLAALGRDRDGVIDDIGHRAINHCGIAVNLAWPWAGNKLKFHSILMRENCAVGASLAANAVKVDPLLG